MSDKAENSAAIGILEKISENKKLRTLIIIALIVAVVVILLCGFVNTDETSAETNDEVIVYVDRLENRLSELLSEVEGAGKVKVALSVASGRELVLAMKKNETITDGVTKIEETPITVNGKTVTVKELYPEITGVLIVAEGAKNLSVLTRIQQAASSLLNIDINRIEILTMK